MLIAKEVILYIILSLFFFNIFNKYFSKFIIDRPVHRSSHIGNTPTSAGIIFILIHLSYVLFNKDYAKEQKILEKNIKRKEKGLVKKTIDKILNK